MHKRELTQDQLTHLFEYFRVEETTDFKSSLCELVYVMAQRYKPDLLEHPTKKRPQWKGSDGVLLCANVWFVMSQEQISAREACKKLPEMMPWFYGGMCGRSLHSRFCEANRLYPSMKNAYAVLPLKPGRKKLRN